MSPQPAPRLPTQRTAGVASVDDTPPIQTADERLRDPATQAQLGGLAAWTLPTAVTMPAATPDIPGGKTLPLEQRRTATADAPVAQALALGSPAPFGPPIPPALAAPAQQTTQAAAARLDAMPPTTALEQVAQAVMQGPAAAAASRFSDHSAMSTGGTVMLEGQAPAAFAMDALLPEHAEQARLAALQTESRPEHTGPVIARPLSTLPAVPAQFTLPTLPVAMQAVQAVLPATVHLPIGTPDWGAAMSQQVLFAVQGQQQLVTLHLNPPQLGPLEVHLQLHDGLVQAQFVSAHAVVRQAVEAALPQLRDLLGSAGLSLGHASVSTQSGQGEHQPPPRAPRGVVSSVMLEPAGVEPAVSTAARPVRWQQGMVNTYV
jgi:flagellar hook-length control protein FliK